MNYEYSEVEELEGKFLDEGDSVLFGDHFRGVVLSERHDPFFPSETNYFLNIGTLGCNNGRIFEMFDIDKKALQIETLGYTRHGDFPYCDTLEHLTTFVKALMTKIESKRKSKMRLAVDDNILLGGIEHTVCGGEGSYWLDNPTDYNDKVFTKYNINKTTLQHLTLGYHDMYDRSFPPCNTLEDLEKFIIEIQKCIDFRKFEKDEPRCNGEIITDLTKAYIKLGKLEHSYWTADHEDDELECDDNYNYEKYFRKRKKLCKKIKKLLKEYGAV